MIGTHRLLSWVAVRRLAALALVAAAPAMAAPAVAGAQSRAEIEKILQRRVLPNGLEVIVIENHGVPLATIEIDVKNGSYTQTPEYAGLAHMYEHMFFKANAKYPEPEQFTDRAAELGASFNGTTSEERVNYYMHLPADSLAGGMEFMAAALRTPSFRQDELERERQVVLGEYDRAESSPFFGLTSDVTKKVYPGQWSRKNTIGDREVIRTVTPQKMREIQRRYYVPNNTALIVTGDVTPAKVFALAEQHYGDWAKGGDPFAADPIPPIPAIGKNEAVIEPAPVSAVTVFIQWQGPSVGKDPASTYAADVFSDALNQATSGFQRRLVDSGLFESVGVNYYTLNQVGPITISGQTSPEKLRRALAALDVEIAKLDDPGYFTAAQLTEVKALRTVSSAFGVERTSGLTHTVGFWWSVASLEYFMGYNDNMAKQTPADLQRYAARYIVGKPHITGILLSPEAQQTLKLSAGELVRAGGGK
ncbi:MAG: M16 family metallopeptidase [Gemmatimonadaceae bacterium]